MVLPGVEQSIADPEQTVIRPQIYSYMNYRHFLQDYYNYLSSKNSQFSETAFIRKAGYCSNSRGYLGLIIKGKRNLSTKAIVRFAQACEMNSGESNYFENLVHFNQAKNIKERDFYFQRIAKKMKSKSPEVYQLLQSQYNYCSQWYVVAIRELVSLDDFVEDPEWIAKRFNYKVTKKQITQAIEDLLALKLLKRDEQGRPQQAEALVRFAEGEATASNFVNFHQQMLELSGEALERNYQERSASSVILTCQADELENIRQEIAEFRAMILAKYGDQIARPNQMLAMNIQLFPLTQTPSATQEKH